jgi:4-hydroxy-tetrahydrodipicolinate synthase
MLHGVIPATPTPFTPDGELDEDCLRRLIEDFVAAGVHGVSVAGSQGEFYALDRAERIRVVEIAVAAAGGRVPVYAGAGATSTRETVRLVRAVEAAGADVAMVITPYFVSPSAAELTAHYQAVAAATSLPVLIYTNPPRTGVTVPPAVWRDCAAIPNVAGIKDSSGDLSLVIAYLHATRPDQAVFCGRDTLAFAMLAHGAAGAISPAACVFPELMVRLYDQFRAGELDQARRTADLLVPLRQAWELGSFPVVIKEAMALTGRDPGPARLPVQPLAPAARAGLRTVVDRIRDQAGVLAVTRGGAVR